MTDVWWITGRWTKCPEEGSQVAAREYRWTNSKQLPFFSIFPPFSIIPMKVCSLNTWTALFGKYARSCFSSLVLKILLFVLVLFMYNLSQGSRPNAFPQILKQVQPVCIKISFHRIHILLPLTQFYSLLFAKDVGGSEKCSAQGCRKVLLANLF